MTRKIANFVKILPSNKIMRRILLLIYFTISLITPVAAQLYQYMKTSDGLSSRRVLSIQKDRKGYMWFLTHEGIDRYNGKQYVHYPLTIDGRPMKSFANLNTLEIDTAGVIWEIGKNGYIFKYNSLQDTYELVCNFANKDKSNSGLPLTATYIDQNNYIWLCTKNKQYIFNIAEQKLIRLNSPIEEEITSIAEAGNNQYYLGTNHNVYCVKLDHYQLQIEKHEKLNDFHIVNYLYFHKNTQTLIVGTLLDGIFLYNIHNRQLIDIQNGLLDINVNAVIANPKTLDEVLVATNGAGVYKLNLFTHNLSPYLVADHNHSNKMNGNIINDIYIDENEKVWMAVYPIGITAYLNNYPSYSWIQHSYDNPNSLIDNQVNSILEDSDGDIWFATSNGVCFYNRKNKQWKSMLSSYHNDTQNQNHVFISLCESYPGKILVGGYMSGMYLINKKDMIPHYFTPQIPNKWNSIRPDKYIRCIYKDNEGMVWAGGYYNLKCYNTFTKEIDCYSMDFPITYITSKDENNLWIGTINGLYHFNKQNKTMKPINLSSEIGCINTIYQDSNKVTYIGTHGSGMWVYNNHTDKVTHYYSKNSALLSNNIYCILPCPDGSLIISTEGELSRFKTKEKIFSNWTKEQGLMCGNFNPASGVHTREGKFIFGTGDGIITLSDTVRLPHRYKSRMVFSNFSILYQKVLPGDENSPLTKEIDDTEYITLDSDQNIFSLNVSSINYDNPSNVMYSWKLEGFYDEWTTPTSENLIRYTNISPGHYKLRVRAILMDDEHVLEERSINITITPPFWATFWAGIVYLIIVVLIASSILRFLWLRKDRNNSKEKIQFFINTAHDIRTPLTLIKAPLGEILKSEQLTEQGKVNINLAIQNTDNLSELASNLINFEKEELYTSTIYVSRYALNSYIKTYLEQFELYAHKKEIKISFETDFDELEVWLDRNKMDSIIRNLITNALKYTKQGGTIKVQTHKTKAYWFLTIADNGIGISANDQKKMFKSLFRGKNATNLQITGSGIGMLLTYRLIKNHGGRVSMYSTENIGTTFHLSFPIKSRKYNHRIFPKSDIINPLPVINKEEDLNNKAINTPKLKQADAQSPYLLIVEDNVELRTFLLQTLSDQYRVFGVGNGQEALNTIKDKQPDLILSDIMMPVMNGDQMCRILKNNMETSHIPIILLTALNDKDSIIKGLETKADKYIIKPFDVVVLKANITNVLANRELVRKRFAQFNFEIENDESHEVDLDQEFIIKATEIIKGSTNKEMNVDTLCSALNMSRSSFYNKIKALTNYAPSDFIRKVRMSQAASLLKSKKYTVAEVSDMLGFGDPKYFTDTFKKYYNVPPSTYMKQN